MLFNKSLHSLFIIWQAAVETQTLLRLRQPLQQDVNGGVKLLSLIPGDTDQSGKRADFFHPPPPRLQYLTQRLLQARLLGHREVAHALPAGAQLLHLHLDPGRVVVAALDQLPGRALEGLNADCPLP